MKKENLVKYLTEGMMAFAELKEEDTYLFCIVSEETQYFIPCLKRRGIGSAYIDSDVIDDVQYEILNDMFEIINREKIFVPTKFTPKYIKAGDFEKEVVGFIRPSGINYQLPCGIKTMLEDAGYKVSINLEGKLPFKKRDYGTQIEDNPEFKKQYEMDIADLQETEIKYEDFPSVVKLNAELMAEGGLDAIFLTGVSGTGKSEMCKAIACHMKAHREHINITCDTTVEELLGRWVPDDRPGSQSKVRFVAGPVIKAWDSGCFLHIDEINNAPAGVLSVLNQVFDGNKIITTDDGVIHYKHPNFCCMATGNPGYEGTLDLNSSLVNRFSVINIEEWTEEKYQKILGDYSEKLGHRLSRAFITKLLEYAGIIRADSRGSRWHENPAITIRNAKDVLGLILLRPLKFEEFADAIHSKYTNLLCVNNDNNDKLKKFKQEEIVVNNLKKMYELYDFSVIAEAKTRVKNLNDLFAPEKEESEDKSFDKSELFDEIVDRFGLDEK